MTLTCYKIIALGKKNTPMGDIKPQNCWNQEKSRAEKEKIHIRINCKTASETRLADKQKHRSRKEKKTGKNLKNNF